MLVFESNYDWLQPKMFTKYTHSLWWFKCMLNGLILRQRTMRHNAGMDRYPGTGCHVDRHCCGSQGSSANAVCFPPYPDKYSWTLVTGSNARLSKYMVYGNLSKCYIVVKPSPGRQRFIDSLQSINKSYYFTRTFIQNYMVHAPGSIRRYRSVVAAAYRTSVRISSDYRINQRLSWWWQGGQWWIKLRYSVLH